MTGCAAQVQLGGPLIPRDGMKARFSSGSAGMCAIRAPGDVVCWQRPDDKEHMVEIGIKDAIEISVGDEHACALRSTGHVVCWGKNDQAQLGRPDGDIALVMGVADAVRVVVSTDDSTCALEKSGKIRCWGDNSGLVDNGPRRLSTATLVPGIEDAIDLARAPGLVCALHRGGAVSCWGQAQGTPVPTRIEGISDAVQVSASGIMACARLATGRIQCWLHPLQTQSFGVSDRYKQIHAPDVTDAADVMVSWANVCVRKGTPTGPLVCAGGEFDDVFLERELSAFDGAEAVAPMSTKLIFCGVDKAGGIISTPETTGFCGEDTLLTDAAGNVLR